MRPFFWTTLLVLLTLLLLPGSILHSRAQSQAEMNATAESDFEKADKELNEVYQKAIKSMGEDSIAKQKLIDAQKAWLKFRDAQAALDADSARGGSMAPMLYSMSCTESTKTRTIELRKWLASQTAQ